MIWNLLEVQKSDTKWIKKNRARSQEIQDSRWYLCFLLHARNYKSISSMQFCESSIQENSRVRKYGGNHVIFTVQQLATAHLHENSFIYSYK